MTYNCQVVYNVYFCIVKDTKTNINSDKSKVRGNTTRGDDETGNYQEQK